MDPVKWRYEMREAIRRDDIKRCATKSMCSSGDDPHC